MRFDGDSFGSNCPDNWQEIVDYLNDVLGSRSEGMDEREIKETMEEIWEQYCSGSLEGAPEAIFRES